MLSISTRSPGSQPAASGSATEPSGLVCSCHRWIRLHHTVRVTLQLGCDCSTSSNTFLHVESCLNSTHRVRAFVWLLLRQAEPSGETTDLSSNTSFHRSEGGYRIAGLTCGLMFFRAPGRGASKTHEVKGSRETRSGFAKVGSAIDAVWKFLFRLCIQRLRWQFRDRHCR